MSIGPFRHLPARLRPHSLQCYHLTPPCLNHLGFILRRLLQGELTVESGMVGLASEIASEICKGELCVGLIYQLEHNIECVFFFDHSPRCRDFHSVRVVAWIASDGYVASEIVSPW